MVLLAVPMWRTWSIHAVEQDDVPVTISTVAVTRLRQLEPRLHSNSELGTGRDAHQLVRFNILNLSEQPVTITAVALTTVHGERLVCDVVPPILVAPDARYPIVVEVTRGPVNEAVQVEVDTSGQRLWVPAQFLPQM